MDLANKQSTPKYTDQLSGTIERFIYQNAENGFAVFVLHHKKQAITAKGYIPAVHPGEQVHLQGSWIYHPKFGKQFEVSSCSASLPTTLVGIQKYLSSGLIRGIGPIYAQKLIETFKEEVLEVIDKHPERLKQVDGIGPKRLEQIVSAWQDQKEISHIMIFLQEKEVSPAYATKIYKKYGHRSIELMIENPYRLCEDIWGVGFKTADAIAQKMGFAFDSLKRISAGTLHTISTAVSSGSLYLELSELKERTTELLGLDAHRAPKQLKQGLHTLYEEQKIKLITHHDYHYIALSQHYFSEKGVAQRILNLKSQPARINVESDAIYRALREGNNTGIALNEEQQRSIMTALQEKVTVITGGPGTGKTTLIKSLLELLEAHNLSYKLAAPTGRAAKRMSEGTGRPAATLHRLLEFDVSRMGFTRNESNALPIDMLVIDEASMIDIFLAQAILKAVSYHTRLLFIGDIDQLPSVGAGNFLNDLIASGAVSTIRLEHIFRQAQDSMIIVNAHRINNGEFPTSSPINGKRDFIFIKEQEPEHVRAHLEHTIKNGLKKFGLSVQDCMVLVPMNRGSVGTQQLNYYLQQMINGAERPGLQHAGSTYKVGDRVMQLRNNYDKSVFNGDTGYVTELNTAERTLTVQFDGRPVPYQSSELDEIVLAYAVSIHKSQGSEYPAVIVPIFMQHFTLLQRNLIYTAITRAKKLCIFIGQTKAIAMAINNNKTVKRTTFLQEFLTSDLSAR